MNHEKRLLDRQLHSFEIKAEEIAIVSLYRYDSRWHLAQLQNRKLSESSSKFVIKLLPIVIKLEYQKNALPDTLNCCITFLISHKKNRR